MWYVVLVSAFALPAWLPVIFAVVVLTKARWLRLRLRVFLPASVIAAYLLNPGSIVSLVTLDDFGLSCASPAPMYCGWALGIIIQMLVATAVRIFAPANR